MRKFSYFIVISCFVVVFLYLLSVLHHVYARATAMKGSIFKFVKQNISAEERAEQYARNFARADESAKDFIAKAETAAKEKRRPGR